MMLPRRSFYMPVHLSAKTERLRQFVGLENTNLMRIMAKATDMVKAKLSGNKKRVRRRCGNDW